MSTEQTNNGIQPLGGSTDYEEWCAHMLLLFESKNVKKLVLFAPDDTKPRDPGPDATNPMISSYYYGMAEWRTKNVDTRLLILAHVSPSIKRRLLSYNLDNACDMWRTLAEIVQPCRSVCNDINTQDATTSLLNLNMSAFKGVEEYVNKFRNLSDAIGDRMSNEIKAAVLYVNLRKVKTLEATAREILLDVEHESDQAEMETHFQRVIRTAQLEDV